ncbi:MAG: hypothetical protein B6D59_03820 [Campylobacteraceae bacterium 4484_4]|nr:MAG: hypothetical protein B6D59_03820 [Campylobacteraceae bacterium 4484_4]
MISKITALCLTGMLFLSGCGKKEEHKPAAPKTEKRKSESQEAQTLTLITTDNLPIKLTATPNGIKFEGYEGKVVLLDFFATWCPPCKAEIPHLADLQKRYKEKLQIIGILMEENKDNTEVRAFMEDFKMNFPVTNSPANFELSQALGGVRSLPTMVMYDKNGSYFTHYVGAAPEEMIEADIKKALSK